MKKALYIGRFQPFHRGHFDAISQIFAAGFDKVFVGIGSAEENYTDQNPFTAGERFEMIENVLTENGISAEKFSIIPIRNINHYAIWTHHVLQFLPKIDAVFSGSPLVQMLWKNHSNLPVFSLQKNFSISASIVRQKILLHENLEDFLFPSTIALLEHENLNNRIECLKTE